LEHTKESDDDEGDAVTARDDARALVTELKTVLGPLLCGLGEGNPPGTDDPVRLLGFARWQLEQYHDRISDVLEEAADGCDEDAP
jgi:hypothetical protein